MPISDKFKIIFVHIPKNGGTTVEKALNMRVYGHRHCSEYRTKYPREWRAYKKICFLRDPFDRLVSCYTYARMEKSYWHSKDKTTLYGKHPDYDICKNMSFEQVVSKYIKNEITLRHQGWPPQSNWIFQNGKNLVDEMYSIEKIDWWLEKHGAPRAKKLNSSNRNQEILFPGYLKKMVEEKYKKDFELFWSIK